MGRLIRGGWPYLLVVLAFVADRASKWWVDANLADGDALRINQHIFLQKTYNDGIAFGLFQGIGQVMGWITIFIVAGLLIYLARLPRYEWLVRAGLGLLIGGALGNMIDRILAGRVLDFVHTPLRSGVFNISDVMINVGMVLMILGAILHRPPEEAVPEEDVPETADPHAP